MAARRVMAVGHGDAPAPARGRGKALRIVPKRRRRAHAGHPRLVVRHFRRVHLRAQADQLARHAGQRLLLHRQLEAHHRLEQHIVRLHERMADRAVRRLAEIAALRVLEVRAPGDQAHAHVGQRASGQHAGMRALQHMRADQPLPVDLQRVGRARRLECHAAARRARQQLEPHLRIVAQRLIVPDAHHGRGDRLAVDHLRWAEGHAVAEAALQHAAEHLGLHRAHDAHAHAPLPRAHAQQRILLLQLAQVRQQVYVVQRAQRLHVHAHQRRGAVRLLARSRADVHARAGGQPRDGRRLPGLQLRKRHKPRPLRETQRVHLFHPGGGAHLAAHAQRARERLHIRIAHAVLPPHAVDQPGKRLVPPVVIGRVRQRGNRLQQRVHAAILQRAAREHGKQLPRRHRPAHPGQIIARLRRVLQVRFQQRVVALGQRLAQRVRLLRHIHAVRAEQAAKLQKRERRLRAIRLVQEDHRRNPPRAQQAKERDRVALHALRAGDDQQRHVQHAQRALGLAQEIDVPRRVHQRDVQRPVPARQVKRRLLAEDRDAPRPLDRVAVHEGVAVVDAPRPAQHARVREQLLAQRRLARVDVRGHAQRQVHAPSSSRGSCPSGAAASCASSARMRAKTASTTFCWWRVNLRPSR